jgi:hypothetical protein
MRNAIKSLALAASLFTMTSAAAFIGGCETHHAESDKTTITGAHKHEETTTTKNPITGDVSTSHTEQKTRP